MFRTVFFGLGTIALGLSSFNSCKMSCVPIPASELPTPIEVKIDVPEGTAVFTDSEVDMVLRHWHKGERNQNIVEHQSKSEWEMMAGEQGVVSLAVYTVYREIDLYNFRQDGKIYWFRTPDQIDLSSFGSSYSVGKRVIDRDRMTLTVYADDRESTKTILVGIGGFVLFIGTFVFMIGAIACFSDWRRHRKSNRAVE